MEIVVIVQDPDANSEHVILEGLGRAGGVTG